MTKEATPLVSFKDLMQAKMDREQRDSAPNSTLISKQQDTLVALEPLATLETLGRQRKKPVAPEKDFSKVANSIVREAVSQGLFIGKSKQIYDYLYSLTRGAIQPKRTIRISKPNLMRGASVGSEVTLLKNLAHLKFVGLIKVIEIPGQRLGNEYEVLLPEEIERRDTLVPLEPLGRLETHYSPQKVEPLEALESSNTRVTQTVENKDASVFAKTSFKDNTKNDDDARANAGLSVMIKRFEAATKKLTGKSISTRDADAWGTLADLLILELEVAASRTDGVSSVPAFLTEVLRRQFFASRQQQSSGKPAKTKIDTVGKTDAGAFEIKPLDAKGREDALTQLREFAGDDFLEDFKKWYTLEDWSWLMENLGASDK